MVQQTKLALHNDKEAVPYNKIKYFRENSSIFPSVKKHNTVL